MTLPIYQTDSKDLNLLQTNWSTQINPVLSLPINSGLFLKGISLVSGSNTINHRLGRKLQGWFITRKRASASIYDLQDSNPRPELTLVLNSSGTVSIDLFVF